MRGPSTLLLILSLALAGPAFAAQTPGARAPAKKPDNPVEQIYLESEVAFDQVQQFASDRDGLPVTGTIQSFYPNGRLAWETQWVDGRLHGVTKGYYENRKLKEETTWVDGKLHGPAKWYDSSGKLLRETVYENDKDPAAPDAAPEQDTPAGQDAGDAPADQDKAREATPQ
jgi:hypothetical protein